MHLKMLSGKWRPFCLTLNVLSIITDTLNLILYDLFPVPYTGPLVTK